MIGMNTSFGRSGVQDWWLQRLSAIALLIYSLVLAVQLISIDEITFLSWQTLFAPLWMQLLTLAAVVAISIHAWVGLWIVSTDYIKPVSIRNLFQVLVLVICLVMIGWTGWIFWG